MLQEKLLRKEAKSSIGEVILSVKTLELNGNQIGRKGEQRLRVKHLQRRKA